MPLKRQCKIKRTKILPTLHTTIFGIIPWPISKTISVHFFRTSTPFRRHSVFCVHWIRIKPQTLELKRRGSVVRTSVFGWRTLLDLCPIYGWHVTTSREKCALWVNEPGQLSLPSLRGRKMSCNPWITAVETTKRQTRVAYGCRPKSVDGL